MEEEYMINESLFPTMTFYHGSPYKLDKILPTAFSAGNKLRDPEWAVFMFGKKEYAKYYAMSMVVQDTVKEQNKKQSELPSPRGWLAKNGINSYKFYGVVVDRVYDYVKSLCLGKKYYVYTLEVPINTKLDIIGTTNTLPEYTYAGIPKTVKVDEYTITEKEFDSLHRKVSQEEYDTIKKISPHKEPIVNKVFQMLQLDPYSREKNRRITRVLIKQGDLKPGDDLKFLNDSETYYRLTYKGEGIYNAVKNKVSNEEWRKLLKNPNISWMPKPPSYLDGYRSYFTKDGFSKFWDKSRKIIYNILDEDDIELDKKKISNKDIIYRDEYQVVVKHSLSESVSSNEVKLDKDDFDENMHFIKTHAKTPKDLNTILNKFDYGYFTKDGTYYDENHVGDFSDYTTMDPRDVIKFAVGVCWDFAETEAYLFDKLFNYKITNKALKNGTYSLYYMEHDDSKGMSPTHTWLAYMENDKVYLFEPSWFKYQGIHEFNSEMEIIEFYDKAQRENETRKGNKLRGGIFIKYLPVRRYGLKPLEFMTHIYKCNTSRLMKVSPEFPIPCKIQPVKEDTDMDMIFNEELEKGNNVIFSEDDIYCNMDKWDNHESHVLFILGLSASGKSTLSRKLAEKYKCNLIELDVIAFAITGEKAHDKGRQTWEYIKKADHMLYKFMKEKGLEPDFMRHVDSCSHQRPLLDKKVEREKQRWVDKYIHWVCFEQKERCVLEGGHACVTIANHKEYREFPIIFKGSSLLKSMVRRVKRTWVDDNRHMGPIELAKYLVILYKQYGKMFPEVNAARNAVITKDNFKIIKEYRDLEDTNTIFDESTFISDKDLVWNFDKWKRGDINLLFICGYSGGGKSTLSRILAKKYNCPLSEMDMENQEIKKTYHNELSQYGPGGTFGNPKKMEFIINKYIERYGNKGRRIIEGVQLASVDFDFIKDYAVIFKGTSAVTASMRAWKRAFTDDENAERWAEDKSTLGKLKYKLQQGPNRLKTNINKVGPFMEKFYADMKKAGAKEMEYEDIVNPNTEDFHIPLLISGDDVYVNFDKWKEGKCNTLFILGLSGSGKSTLGKKLAKARKAFYVETDKIRGNSHYSDAEMRKDHPLILRWFESQYDKDRRGFNSLDKSIRKKEWDRCVEWMINQKEPKVIEGAIEEFLLEHPEYSEYPIVFKNTSMLKSIVRMTRRQLFEVDKSKVDDYNTQFLKWWLKHIQKYNDMRKRNNNVRDTIIGKKENSYEVMKESRTLKDDDVYFIKCKWEDGDKRGLVTNACKDVNGEVYRVRTEMLVVKDGKVLCVKDYHDNLGLGYKLPGGSVEKGISYAEQAAEEVKEEARIIINPKSILDTGITYIRKYTKQPRWISHLTPPIPYVGGISYVYVGEYKSDFNGDIPDVHRDDGFYKRARFYDIDEINWIPEHKKALDMYLEKNMQKQDQSKDTYENALKIFNSLTPKEQYWMDDRYVDSPHTFYRKVHFIGRKPVGFVDTYRFHPNDPGVIIVLAVNKSYRGKGIASDLVKSATLYCKSKGIKKIIWRAHKDNYASIQLAKKLGYTKTNENEKSYRFEKTL